MGGLMSYAPKALLAVRAYVKPLTGLSDVELGIVGDEEHDGGYHHGWDDRRIVDGVLRDYSWQESPRDWNHKTNAARGFDLGWFDRVVYGRRVTLIDLNLWLAKELEAGAPDTIDIRELIYTPDGTTVRRWDRLKKRTSGDNSHLKHSHLSYFADAEDRDKTAVFRRFFEGEDMSWNETLPLPAGEFPELEGQASEKAGLLLAWTAARGRRQEVEMAKLSAKVDALELGGVDLDALAAKVAEAVLSVKAELAKAVLDEDHARSAD